MGEICCKRRENQFYIFKRAKNLTDCGCYSVIEWTQWKCMTGNSPMITFLIVHNLVISFMEGVITAVITSQQSVGYEIGVRNQQTIFVIRIACVPLHHHKGYIIEFISSGGLLDLRILTYKFVCLFYLQGKTNKIAKCHLAESRLAYKKQLFLNDHTTHLYISITRNNSQKFRINEKTDKNICSYNANQSLTV